ncbi:MAG TPA: glycoside hydrolase family 1 protein [Candidatus Saccharimonadales bacterium]|jgi:beta-glucosidase|nr:glycoside hydrolase family 1 protein [Candidatus Saccharimonadales bacterium]
MQSFPKDFFWGASTASHQVEGGTDTQWDAWERANAERLVTTAEKRLSWLPDWQGIKAQATDPANYICGNGVEHYQRYREDFQILKQLNMNAFRFSIEWARIEPREGEWDAAAIQHYHDYIAELRRLGIEPFLTLWHWTMPRWFTDKGGFERRENVRYFERYAAKIAEEFGSNVRHMIILNEPNIYTLISYGIAEWPPQRKNPLLVLRVYRHLVRAHTLAARAIKKQCPDVRVGIAMAMETSRPLSPHNPLNKIVPAAVRYLWNFWFVDRIKHHLDFVGINFYSTSYYKWYGPQANPKTPVNDLGWYMEPRGLEELLGRVHRRYGKPLFITENGAADRKDQDRTWWLQETVAAMQGAIDAGVDLRGYLHWSLLDNFEWSHGWWPEFGLVHVDRKTMQRTIRPSAQWLADQLK